jgi:hypothetical protein
LLQAYEQFVKIDSKADENAKFWEDFLVHNLQYQTTPFGGHNPIFVPYLTDQKDYEEEFMHNQ